jgi:Carboxypeptidase regulatory-like domain/Divergent InlB B-repeat domain
MSISTRVRICAAVTTMACGVILFVTCTKDNHLLSLSNLLAVKSVCKGTVVDKNGSGLAGIAVTAESGQNTITDQNGIFTLPDLTAGRHVIHFSSGDYIDTLTDSIEFGLADTQYVTKPDNPIKLRYRWATISGIVSYSGNGLFGAGVAVDGQDISTIASSGGNFTLVRVAPGPVRICASGNGQGTGIVTVTTAADSVISNITVNLSQAGGALSGEIRNQDGSIASNATVSALGGAIRVTSDSAGKFRIADLPATRQVILHVSSGSDTMNVGVTATKDSTEYNVGIIAMQGSVPVLNNIALTTSDIYSVAQDDSVSLIADAKALASNKIVSYDWDLDNSGSFDTTTAASSFKVANGVRTVRVHARDNSGLLSAVALIHVIPVGKREVYYVLSVSGNHGIFTQVPNALSYDSGTTIKVVQKPDTAYRFSGWSGDTSGGTVIGDTLVLVMNGKRAVSASYFLIPKYALTATADTAAGKGSVSVIPALPAYDSGTVVKVVDAPLVRSYFGGWAGDTDGAVKNGDTITVTMNKAKTITARFVMTPTFTLAFTNDTTHGTLTAIPSAGVYDSGTTVKIAGAAKANFRLKSWSGDTAGALRNAGGDTLTVKMTQNKTINCWFIPRYTLAVSSDTNGAASIVGGATVYDSGAVAKIALAGKPQFHYGHATGDSAKLTVNATKDTVTVPMTQTRNITIIFAKTAFAVSVTSSDNSYADIALVPSTGAYDSGSTVKVTYNLKNGGMFQGWGGDTAGATRNPTNDTLSVFVSRPLSLSVTATAGILVAPVNNDSLRVFDTTLVWAITAGYQYKPFLGTRLDSLKPLRTTFAPSGSVPIYNLNGNSVYYWMVKQESPSGDSSKTGCWTFRTGNHVPAATILVSPGNGVQGQIVPTVLRWSKALDADPGDTVRYRVYCEVYNPPYDLVAQTTDTSLVLDNNVLGKIGTFYWRVQTFDGHDTATSSPVWSFNVGSIAAPSAMAVGDSVGAQLNDAQMKIWTFTAVAGDTILLRSAQDWGSHTVTLMDSTGQVFAATASANSNEIVAPVSVGGKILMSLRCDVASGTLRNISVRLQNLHSIHAAATPITAGVAVTDTLKWAEMKMHKFTLGAQSVVSVPAWVAGGNSYKLYNASGAVLNQDFQGAVDSMTLAAGTYYIGVHGNGTGQNFAQGIGSFQFDNVTDLAANGTGLQTVIYGDSIGFTINPNDGKYFRFSGNAGDTVLFRSQLLGAIYYGSIQLFNSSGTMVWTVSSINSVSDNTVVLPATGSYLVYLMKDASSSLTTPANFSMRIQNLHAIHASATLISAGVAVPDTLKWAEMKMHKFTLSTQSVVSVPAWVAGSYSYKLYDASGTVVSQDFQGAVDSMTLAAGTYYVGVHGNGTGLNFAPGIGSFQFDNVTDLAANGTGLQTAAYGDSIGFSINPNDGKYFRFSGNAGDSVLLRTQLLGADLYGSFQVFSSSGTMVLNVATFNSASENTMILPATGVYLIYIMKNGTYTQNSALFSMRLQKLNTLRSTATPVTAAAPVTDTLHWAQVKLHTLAVSAGDQIVPNRRVVPAGASVKIYKPDGSAFVENFGDWDTVKFAQAGTYLVGVHGQGATPDFSAATVTVAFDNILQQLANAPLVSYNNPFLDSLSGVQKKYYRFSGTLGDALYIRAWKDYTGDMQYAPRITLYDATGKIINRGVGGNSNYFGQNFALPASGNYVVCYEETGLDVSTKSVYRFNICQVTPTVMANGDTVAGNMVVWPNTIAYRMSTQNNDRLLVWGMSGVKPEFVLNKPDGGQFGGMYDVCWRVRAGDQTLFANAGYNDSRTYGFTWINLSETRRTGTVMAYGDSIADTLPGYRVIARRVNVTAGDQFRVLTFPSASQDVGIAIFDQQDNNIKYEPGDNNAGIVGANGVYVDNMTIYTAPSTGYMTILVRNASETDGQTVGVKLEKLN